jgi:HAD superfamily hydrolase (TIGR01450 family)
LDASVSVPTTTVSALLARYDVFLLDAYGVLVNAAGAMPGAMDFLERLHATEKDYLVLSNDASRLPATSARRYQGFGVTIDPAQILTSGTLLVDHFAANGLCGKRCIVLGTEDSNEYVRMAGGRIAVPTDDSAEIIVVADDDDYPFLETINDAVTVLMRRLERGQHTHLVMPNPDVLYPRGPNVFGICSGAIAAMFESAARLRDPSGKVRFVPLGKPHRPMFEAALQRFADRDPRRMVMIGDQLGTDILGANKAGIDSVLILTGLGRPAEIAASGARPTLILSDFLQD